MTPNFWDSWPKPWTREQCRDRYVQGPKIGLRPLSEISEIPKRTLYKWSAQDDWVGQREHFGSERRAKTDEKFVESQSEELSRS